MTNRTKGILFILGEGFSFAVMNLFIRLAGDVPLMEKIFFREFQKVADMNAVDKCVIDLKRDRYPGMLIHFSPCKDYNALFQ